VTDHDVLWESDIACDTTERISQAGTGDDIAGAIKPKKTLIPQTVV
jgi:hypothetical protein